MNNYNKKIPKTRRVKALVVLASRYGKKKGLLSVIVYLLWDKGIDFLGKFEDLKNFFEYLI